jgi:two-component SAPR family response regulator
LEKIYAVELYSKDYIRSDIKIFSINHPALVESTEPDIPTGKRIYVLIFILLVILSAAFLLFRKLRLNKRLLRGRLFKDASLEKIERIHQKNAIYFFGGFQVFNRDGEDITKKFTNLLKELFLLILLKSIGENSTGISSDKLFESLWFDKNLKSGRNNLSVNIAKLKGIFKELDGIKISHESSYWKFVIDSKLAFVEYKIIYKILEKEQSHHSSEDLCNLLNSANSGQFLPNLSYEWLDAYKGLISDKMVDTLIQYAEALNPRNDTNLIIQICDSVFNFDIINEEAMTLKCRMQSQLGKHSIAKSTYESFCKEYEILYGEKYGKTFGDIVNE